MEYKVFKVVEDKHKAVKAVHHWLIDLWGK